MDLGSESMQVEEASTRSDIDLFRNQIELLESQKNHLLTQLEQKNGKITDGDQKNFHLLQENDLLKLDIVTLNEQNEAYQKEINRLTDLLSNDESKEGDSIQENRKLLLSSPLINDLNLKIVELQQNKKNFLIENIENLVKLNQNNNDLAVLKENNELSQKFIKSKDDYISLLVEYIVNSKSKFLLVESSFREEIRARNEIISTYQKENDELKKQNKLLETNLVSTKSNVTNLSEKLINLQEEFDQVKEDQSRYANEVTIEKNIYVREIENLNDLLKRSKDEIVEQYIEKIYPNITGLCQMFDKNVTVSQLYSLYLEQKRSNADLKIENTVLGERVTSLEYELDSTKEAAQKYLEEIQVMGNLEGEIFHLKSDKKELSVALKFYQEASQNFYKGSKAFNENFLALAEKIQLLAQQTNDANDDSTLALSYIMQLQSKFQEFSKLQTEFEKGKIDFINEKKNLIVTENEIESLRSQVELLESEKRIYSNKYELLGKEYDMLQSLMQNAKQNYEIETDRLKNNYNNLKVKFDGLAQELATEKVKLEDLQKSNVTSERLKNEIELELQNRAKEIEFVQQRLSTQQNIASQLEKSLTQLRKQNSTLTVINQKLMNNINSTQESQSRTNHKLQDLNSQLLTYKFKANMLAEKESMLTEKLSANQKDSLRQEELTSMIDSLRQTSSSIEGNLLAKIRLIQNERDNFAKLNEQNEKNWQEEKQAITLRITQLEALISEEMTKYNSLNVNYIKLQEIKSITLNENGPVDEVLKSENTLLKSQLDTVASQFQEVTIELNSLKQKFLESTQENSRLLELRSGLQIELNTLNNDKATISAQLVEIQKQLQTKVAELESKNNLAEEKHSLSLAELNSELNEKESCCQQYLGQIECLNNRLADLNWRLEQSVITANNAEEQLKLYTEKYVLFQKQYEKEIANHSQNFQLIVDLRKRIDELQGRINELEQERISLTMNLRDQLKSSKSNYNALQNEYKQMRDLFVSIQHQNILLCNQMKDLQLQMSQESPSTISNSSLIDVTNLNGVIDNLTAEIRLLNDKCDTFAAKEARLNSEIENLRSAQMLESRLLKESENMTSLKDILSQNADQRIESMSETVLSLRAEKDKLKRECSLQKQVIEHLEQQISSEDMANLNKNLTESKLQIELLSNQLSAGNRESVELKQNLKLRQERIAKLEKDVRELLLQINNQNATLDSLKKELEEKESLNNSNKLTIDNLKSTLAVSDETKTNLNVEIESLRKSVESLQSTNQKIKILARKYKQQYDELQKSNSSGSADQSTQSSDGKIAELEEKIQMQITEFEKSHEEINRLLRENEQLRERAHSNQILSERTSQELLDKDRLIASQQSTLATLRAELGQKSISIQPSTSNGNSNKRPISSTYVSASMPSTSFDSAVSSNLQPSSSSTIEDSISLQSHQITSHSTSADDNASSEMFSVVASQAADSNVSSNKRGYISDSAFSHPKKARRVEPESVQFEDENSSESIEIIEEDSNDVSATDFAPVNYAENNEESVENEETAQEDNEDPNINVSSNVQFDDQSDGASSSHLVSRPSSFSYHMPPTSSLHIDPLLTQAGPSSRNRIATSSGVILTSHPLSHSAQVALQPERASHLLTPHNAPRLIIPPNNSNMLSPPNPLMTPMVPFSVEEGEGIVPSTPILYAPRFEESIISPQVPQSRFLFSTSGGSSSTSGTSVTPTISDTVSSVITIDDAVAEYESNSLHHLPTNEQEEEQVSSVPSSSDSGDALQSSSHPEAASNSQEQQQPSSGTLSRPRKLRIRGSTRGRP